MTSLTRSRNFLIGLGFAGTLGALAAGQVIFQKDGARAQNLEAPRYEVDPSGPSRCPITGSWAWRSACSVDTDDHIWIVHRASDRGPHHENQLERRLARCCAGAPPVLEFDQAGNLLRAWGGPGQGYDWPESNHGIFVDHKGNVWIGGNGGPDSQILKFTKDGKFLMQVGKSGARRKAGAAAANVEGLVAGFVGEQQRPEQFRPRRQDLRRRQGKRGLSRRRLPEQARRGDRCRHRQDEALVGRLWQQAG